MSEVVEKLAEEICALKTLKKAQAANIERLEGALDKIKYRLRMIGENPILRRRINQRTKWINTTLEIADAALKPQERSSG